MYTSLLITAYIQHCLPRICELEENLLERPRWLNGAQLHCLYFMQLPNFAE